jgi:5-hydroxyisourate hydrolase-like protein (transthyretin family)
VSNVSVNVFDANTGEILVAASTTSGGLYDVHLLPGPVKISFRMRGGKTIWANGKPDQASADVINVVSGQDITLDQDFVGQGQIVGHLAQSDGSPAAGADVHISPVGNGPTVLATTDAAGDFAATVGTGTYKVGFFVGGRSQYAYGDVTGEEPATFAVATGATVTVNDTLVFATNASETVTAIDAGTRQPLDTFCAAIYSSDLSETECTEDGSISFSYLASGTYGVTTYVEGDTPYLPTVLSDVSVNPGSNALTVKLQRGATVSVTAIDATTGVPVPNACVELVRPTRPSAYTLGSDICTDANGRVSATMLTPDTYNAFISVNDGVHGAQWVGPHGGVGAMADAKRITLASGASVSLTVRLDPAGSITGVITDRATGAPLLASVKPSSRIYDPTSTASDESGRYTLSNLGPYNWTLFFCAADHACQWSGGEGNRLDAQHVRVKAGQTTTYNFKMRTGTVLTGTVTYADGTPFTTGAYLTVVNANSVDELASSWTDATGVYRMLVLGEQDVKLSYQPYNKTEWYGGADFAHATKIRIPDHGTKTVNLVTPVIN